MPRVRALVDRFRPAGAPVAATSAGVPADRRATVTAELEPVFAELVPAMLECDHLRRASAASVTRREAEAAEQARIVVSRARTESGADRAAVAATLREQAADAVSQNLARAEAEAAGVRRRGDARRAELLARVLELVRADLRALVADTDGPGANGVPMAEGRP